MGRALLAVCVAWALCAHAAAQGRPPTLRPSNILDEVKRYKERRPGLKPDALARHANTLLARRGFDYRFDACEILPTPVTDDPVRRRASGSGTLRYEFSRTDGRGVSFDVIFEEEGGMCAECFLALPALRVTKREMTLVSGGAVYELKRPASFSLDEAHLVGADLKTVLRTWQLPYQTIPVGVSPDGKSLYVDFYEADNLDGLVLEISEDGRPSFRVKSEAAAGDGEWIEDHPKDTKNAYLSFKRFRAGGRTHVVRFSAPCT
jgi:hypothetical protein